MLQAVKQQGKIAMQQNQIAEPGFEPGLPDSESGVITTTLYRRCGCGCCEIPEIATYIQLTNYQPVNCLNALPQVCPNYLQMVAMVLEGAPSCMDKPYNVLLYSAQPVGHVSDHVQAGC